MKDTFWVTGSRMLEKQTILRLINGVKRHSRDKNTLHRIKAQAPNNVATIVFSLFLTRDACHYALFTP
jgi:hypothetical protein